MEMQVTLSRHDDATSVVFHIIVEGSIRERNFYNVKPTAVEIDWSPKAFSSARGLRNTLRL
jgi:hypothetical protein